MGGPLPLAAMKSLGRQAPDDPWAATAEGGGASEPGLEGQVGGRVSARDPEA